MARKRVYLIRHGKTPGNIQRRYLGRGTDEALSAEGMVEAKRCRRLTDSMQDFQQDALRVCASPMIRALQTAGILFDRPVTAIKALEEMDFGLFEGKEEKELSKLSSWQSWVDGGCMGQVPGGENLDGFIDRSYAGFLEALGDKALDETIAIVCHGGTIMAVLSRLTGEPYFSFMVHNLCGYRLDLETEDENIHLVSYDRFGGGDPA